MTYSDEEYIKLFYKRFNITPPPLVGANKNIKFEDLDMIMEKIAYDLPFENLEIIYKKNKPTVTRDNVLEKILVNGTGGLCYQLNTMFHFFLKASGFDVRIVRASVLNKETRTKRLPNGHIANIIRHNDKEYLIETGFGNFFAMKPIPIHKEYKSDDSDGNHFEFVQSVTGKYRTFKKDTELGSFILEKCRNSDFIVESERYWNTGYTYYYDEITMEEVSQVQDIVLRDETFAFNKRILVTKLVKNLGQVILTNDSFTILKFNGEKLRESFLENSDRFHEILYLDLMTIITTTISSHYSF